MSSYVLAQIEKQVRLYYSEKEEGVISECSGLMNKVYQLPCRHEMFLENKHYSVPLSSIGNRWFLSYTKDEEETVKNPPVTAQDYEKVDDLIGETIAEISSFFENASDNATRIQLAKDLKDFLASRKAEQEPMKRPSQKETNKGKLMVEFRYNYTLFLIIYVLYRCS